MQVCQNSCTNIYCVLVQTCRIHVLQLECAEDRKCGELEGRAYTSCNLSIYLKPPNWGLLQIETSSTDLFRTPFPWFSVPSVRHQNIKTSKIDNCRLSLPLRYKFRSNGIRYDRNLPTKSLGAYFRGQNEQSVLLTMKNWN